MGRKRLTDTVEIRVPLEKKEKTRKITFLAGHASRRTIGSALPAKRWRRGSGKVDIFTIKGKYCFSGSKGFFPIETYSQSKRELHFFLNPRCSSLLCRCSSAAEEQADAHRETEKSTSSDVSEFGATMPTEVTCFVVSAFVFPEENR